MDMDAIFNKVIELIRDNPDDFQEELNAIIEKILQNKREIDLKISSRFFNIWPECRGKEIIAFAWLLSDTAIGIGEPLVPTGLATVLTKMSRGASNSPMMGAFKTTRVNCSFHTIFQYKLQAKIP